MIVSVNSKTAKSLLLPFACGLLFILLISVQGGNPEASQTFLKADDKALLKIVEASEFQMPNRLFTPEAIARLRQSKPAFAGMAFGNGKLGKLYSEGVAESRWKDLIAPYASFTMWTIFRNASGKCPFCHKPYGGTLMTPDDFLKNPFLAKTACCGQLVYERESDMPPDYKARPNHTEKIPHMDGTVHGYRFYVPPGTENAGPEVGSKRKDWFCSASEVWFARSQLFSAQSKESIIRGLAAAAFYGKNSKAYRDLAAIYDRLAEVYPGMPLNDFSYLPNSLARDTGGKQYLSAAEYRATKVPRPWKRPSWFPWRPYYNFGKLNHAYGWQDGVMAEIGQLAAVFDLIRDQPEVRAFSAEKYNDPNAWEEKVRKGLLSELHFIGQWSTPTRGGNTEAGWINGALELGLVTQDPYFIRTSVEMIKSTIRNHYFSDGMSVEGSFNYGGMMRQVLLLLEPLREYFDIDLTLYHSMLKSMTETGDYRVKTLYGVESMHGDQHAWFFSGNGTGWKIPPEKADYSAHETAECLPEYGLACLRAGKAGCRMESIMDFQTVKAHTHNASLNLQLFYEGINLLPDIGYATRGVDVTRPPWTEIHYPFEKLPVPPETNLSGAWYGGFSNRPEAHCSAMVDGSAPDCLGATAIFKRFQGGGRYGSPEYQAQFVEVETHGLYPGLPRLVYDRQLLAVTLADGEPLLFDFFRLRGGKRHDLFWHVPAAGPDEKLNSNLGPSQPVNGSLDELLNRANPERRGKASEISKKSDFGCALIKRLEKWKMPQKQAWELIFQVRPSQFQPLSEEGKKLYKPWSDALRDVDLKLWGMDFGTPAKEREIFHARGPWPSKIREVVNGEETPISTICLKDAFHFLIPSRTSAQAGLSTAYLHVFEALSPGQAAVVKKVEPIPPDTENNTAMGAGVRLLLSGNSRSLLAATTLDGSHFSGGGLVLDGRLGVAEPAAAALTLYDGSHFAAGNFDVKLEASLRLKLLGVIGDLTGHPGESALIVETSGTLPVDKTLHGQMLTVKHRSNPAHAGGYVIENVQQLGPGRYRIDLRDCPSFILNQLIVLNMDNQDSRKIEVDTWLLKGKEIYTGRRARFPRSGFESAMTLGKGNTPWHCTAITLNDLPPSGSVKSGDPLIIYQIQPGDEVIIPSLFACKGRETPEGLRINIRATGQLTLTVPGGYRNATLLEKNAPLPPTALKATANGLCITLTRDNLPDGRAILLLTRTEKADKQ